MVFNQALSLSNSRHRFMAIFVLNFRHVAMAKKSQAAQIASPPGRVPVFVQIEMAQ
jgi:hypothetical protein